MSNQNTLTEWQKPCGAVINLNDAPATIAEAKKLGWKIPAKKKAAAKAVAKKD